LEHLPDGRVGKVGGASDQPRPPAGGAPAAANALLQFGCKPSRRVGRATRAIAKRLRSAPAVEPTMPPAMRRRRRHVEGGRRRPQRQAPLDRGHQCNTTAQSELGVSVQIHPRPPLSVSPGRPTASKEGRIEPQTFTTSVGSSASYGSAKRRYASSASSLPLTRSPERRSTTAPSGSCSYVSAPISTPPAGARLSSRAPVLTVSPTSGYATWPSPPISRTTASPLLTPTRIRGQSGCCAARSAKLSCSASAAPAARTA